MCKVSVVIISWNSKHFLEKCLKSLYEKNKDIEFELIFIDNNSTDGTGDFVKTSYPAAKCIFNNQNRGVAPARNQGLILAKGEFVLILDVDTEFITDEPLRELYSYMNKYTDVGLIGVQLISGDGDIQRSCLKFPSVWVKLLVRFERFGFIENMKMIKDYYMEDLERDKPQNVDYVIGAFQFIRKKMIDEIGMYDDTIFYGPEDIDFCLRAKQASYRIIYYPHVKLYHFYQRITKRVFTKITYKHLKGLWYFFWKHKYINYPKL